MKDKNVAGVSFTYYMYGFITFRKRAEMIQLFKRISKLSWGGKGALNYRGVY